MSYITQSVRVGLLQLLSSRRYEAAIQAANVPPLDPSTYPIASPWSSSNLQRIVTEDVFGKQLPINTRGAAMRIPTVARARNLFVTSIAPNPLVAKNAAGPLAKNPSWMTKTTDGTSWQSRMVWTIDDLIFYGWSCWWRNNGADGFPLSANRINQGDWSINADNRVEVYGTVVQDTDVILIPGFHEGLLSFGVDVLADARRLYEIVRDRLGSPVPPLNLEQTGGRQLTDEEIDKLVDRWALARKKGGVGYTSEHIKATPLTSGDEQLMIEARNAAAVDLARAIGISAGLVDATTPKSSLNYETQTGRNQEFNDRDLDLYTAPIAARLSMDDVMPAGQACAFNMADFTGPAPSPTGPTVED